MRYTIDIEEIPLNEPNIQPERQGEERPVYQRPAIAWEQELDAAAVGVSCSKRNRTDCQISGRSKLRISDGS